MARIEAIISMILLLAVGSYTNADGTKKIHGYDLSVDSAFKLTSPSFDEKKTIPTRFTCAGEDISPRLEWFGAPEETSCFAIICRDPDAPSGTWIHWVIYSIPADMSCLEQAVPSRKRLKSGIMQGKNDFGKIGYGGPCPPPGKPHRYIFTLYALDQTPEIQPGKTSAELLETISGHIIAQTSLTGFFGKKEK